MPHDQDNKAEWIATSWRLKSAFDEMDSDVPEIHLMNSPDYNGVKYAVRRGRFCLAKDGKWEFEPSPSSRDADFYQRCRFDSFDEAATIAKAALEKAKTELEKRREQHAKRTKSAT